MPLSLSTSLPQGFLQSLESPLRSNPGTFSKWEVGPPWDPSTSEGQEPWMNVQAPLLQQDNSEARLPCLLTGAPEGWSGATATQSKN